MNQINKKVVWFCGLPEKTREDMFSDLNLPTQRAWSWVTGHLPPPPHIDLHIVCADRRIKHSVSRVWKGATFHLLNVPRGGPYILYEGWAPAFVRKARELNPDVVHGWGTECAFGLAALRAAPEKQIIGIQGIMLEYLPVLQKSILNVLCTFNEWRVLRKARNCVAESDYSRRTASKYTKAKFSIVPHPLREEFRLASPGPRDEKIILYLGTLDRRKGFFDAVRAFVALKQDWRLICIGSVDGIKRKSAVESFLKEIHAGDRVHLVGLQSSVQIIEWFRRSPVFLLPSYMDTGPTALKEALSMGLWPVCYDNTGPQELITSHGVGSLSPTGDIQTLTETLRQVLNNEPWQEASRMEQAVAKIRDDLSPAAVWEKLGKVYDSIIR